VLEEPPVYNVGQGMVEFNNNWVESPRPPKPNIGNGGGLGFMRPSSASERNFKLGSRGLLTAATLYSGYKLTSSVWNNRDQGFSKVFKGHKLMTSIFLGSAILTYKSIKS
tara:strand:+ start:311 stop:640 length:330 start_codon:yes stop_codon:yes gene_type:complete